MVPRVGKLIEARDGLGLQGFMYGFCVLFLLLLRVPIPKILEAEGGSVIPKTFGGLRSVGEVALTRPAP